ncbi:geranylgeranylglyceryl diphosphate synthase [Staphylothermus marinus F1]|uniref:Geranylgeranylglyceryl phosphate synthase n=1 Tax=Staphylothermus marinus (strain ATCC 43588 / DSM 3639 / JCM 9404 / F1) TaxID=399550 RepID=GGGPS_STAMF|nr:geranylgeranylglyceryl/heptaprenylglyceryl phosphate synthase [Staphylothermus marinus]A3DN81.1 RecName: Full=Geranylgeranylglyceryl phosphate synthase; Short=GGGP synthase; Short=GGGPS; AltName: Full=(S)-3-O-geranylgeranylglyceryl phosphate synthase; AltName: Full=Phosphoglycerol geranylgeranyltransferase [Staphylothermus marinus F1]ABN70091.1 geranylgeranylglyceryl diphosphate synthase [Staphylothermus marinus F1]
MGKVNKYIVEKINNGEKLHFTLIDPDRVNDLGKLEETAIKMAEFGTDAFLIGGSLGVTPEEAGETAKILKKTGLPVIIFPGNINCLTPYADAVLFMILMNSMEQYYLMHAQIAAAPIIKKYKLETLPTGYIVIYGETAVAHVGRTYPIPVSKPEILLSYTWAAEMIGIKYIYLEAGSGSPKPVPPSFPAIVKKYTNLITIVGGGIRSPFIAKELASSGADIIVTGTIVEEDPDKASKIISAIKKN